MQKSISIVSARIRRDAHTITPVTVLAHELPILYEIYGKENVTFDETVDDARPVDADGEYQRLANKYGLTIVEEVYGRESSGRLADALDRVVAKGSGESGEDDDAAPVVKRRGRRSAQPAPTEDETVLTETE